MARLLMGAVRDGATLVQLRDPLAKAGNLVRFGLSLKAALDAIGVRLIVNDCSDIAFAIEAIGLGCVDKLGRCSMRSKRDRGSCGDPKPIRLYWRGAALEHRPFFISPQSGAAILLHGFAILSPKPDGLVRDNALALKQNPCGASTGCPLISGGD